MALLQHGWTGSGSNTASLCALYVCAVIWLWYDPAYSTAAFDARCVQGIVGILLARKSVLVAGVVAVHVGNIWIKQP